MDTSGISFSSLIIKSRALKDSNKSEDKVNNSNHNSNQDVNDNNLILTEDLILNEIKQSWINSVENKLSYNKTYVSVTDIVDECPLKTIYRFLNNEYDIEIASQYHYSELITFVGTVIHEKIQSLILNALNSKFGEGNIKLEKEKLLIDNELMIKGYIDLVYSDANESEITIVEIKTASLEDFVKLHENSNDSKIPKDKHIEQLVLYCYLYEKLFDKKPFRAQLIYIARDFKKVNDYKQNKSIEPIKIFNFDVEALKQKILPKVLKKFSFIIEHVKHNKLPEAVNKDVMKDVNKYTCSFCPYNKICKFSKLSKQNNEKKQKNRLIQMDMLL